jgi:hypothetical protein
MLPPFIIDQIRKREQEEIQIQPVVELPVAPPRPPADRSSEESDRGVVVIDLMG